MKILYIINYRLTIIDIKCKIIQTRQGSPVDRRPSTVEAPPIVKNHLFSKTAVILEPAMRFGCPSRFIISYNVLT